MTEPKVILMSFQDIVTTILQKEGIHEGIWALYIEFGLSAVNIPIREAADGPPKPGENPLDSLKPTALVPIQKIGIRQADELSNIAVDAAKVNPRPRSSKARKTPKKR